jgi:hypothetical protein
MDHAMVGTVFSVVQTRPGACAPAPSLLLSRGSRVRRALVVVPFVPFLRLLDRLRG